LIGSISGLTNTNDQNQSLKRVKRARCWKISTSVGGNFAFNVTALSHKCGRLGEIGLGRLSQPDPEISMARAS
jgi:hypothetical protein